ncbi:MAG: DUF4145 domain-containing protein [Clostridiales bacterium]|nr:DUF4145 domain-containing protein [Clostridiales bacterium]
MSNFEFLKKNKLFKSFAGASIEAEEGLRTNPVTCIMLSRKALELGVKWLYANDKLLIMPYQNNLSALIHTITFKNIVNEEIRKGIDFIVKKGNFVVHTNADVSRDEAILVLKCLFNFMKWIYFNYDKNYENIEFDINFIPQENNDNIKQAEREKLEVELQEQTKKLEETLRENEELRKQLTEERENKQKSKDFVVKDLSEFETRKQFIDLDLQISGWDFKENITEELEVQGMKNSEGIGYVDYVLFGKNGLPVAVVEAKRTSKNAHEGKQQASLYADCLEEKYGQRPLIYYTNGIEIYFWDNLDYPERKVQGFHTQDELQRIINRRKSKEDLEHIFINDDITNRPYQLEAIKRVCESFENKHRKALLVMATGTGKTRTAISLVDVLTGKGWVQNVLFLADRTELIKQAKKNFVKLLPDMSCCNLLDSKDNPEDSRIVFSTYQTMINAIDTMKCKDGKKLFTPGHFDLIIIDEAHRSIYKKYQSIFEYFDSLLVGLTATPRSDVDKNTYSFFELENNVPTFAYEYQEAIDDGYLVDYHNIKTTTEFLERGIKYSQLKDEEKEEYENLFEEEESVPEEINSSAINSWLFNRDTIKKILETLMEKGLKVEGGDKLGKTIIFAKNHRHAEEIRNVFDSLYPHYNGEFARVIDNKVNYADTLIEMFEDPKKLPQISISVDMLDTGIDVPEILNLVFFKPVKSKVKFWQMIGRGTRLCNNLFGEGVHKKEFYIFDCCNNFEFFEENEKGIETGNTEGLTEKIFNLKLDFIVELQNLDYQDIDEYVKYREELVQDFITAIQNLNGESFVVKSKKKFIEKYSILESWNSISSIDKMEIKENLTPIFVVTDLDESAKRFDNLIYSLQIRKMKEKNYSMQVNGIISLIESLKELGTISQIKEKAEIIKITCKQEYWERATFFDIENIRKELRDLIKFIENPPRKIWNIDIEDQIIVDEEQKNVIRNNFEDYKKKVKKFLDGNMDNLVIYKIKHNQLLTESEKSDLERIMFEELGNNKEFVDTFGDSNVVQVVRNLVGLDRETANQIFSKYINDYRLNSKQIQFVKTLKEYIIANGLISLDKLREQPFSTIGSVSDIFKDNINTFNEIKEDIEMINESTIKLA